MSWSAFQQKENHHKTAQVVFNKMLAVLGSIMPNDTHKNLKTKHSRWWLPRMASFPSNRNFTTALPSLYSEMGKKIPLAFSYSRILVNNQES